MKKYIAAFILLLGVSFVYAAPRQFTFVDTIGPATSSVSTQNSIVIASSTVTGSRLCLTKLDATVAYGSVQCNINLNVLDQGTTVYTVNASTSSAINLSWAQENPLCISPTHAMVITGIPATGASTVTISYMGYSY